MTNPKQHLLAFEERRLQLQSAIDHGGVAPPISHEKNEYLATMNKNARANLDEEQCVKPESSTPIKGTSSGDDERAERVTINGVLTKIITGGKSNACPHADAPTTTAAAKYKMSAKAIATACIETIESANASFTVESRTETITDAEFASVSLPNMFVKRGQSNEGDKEAKKQQDTAATDSSQGLANKRNSSILDLVKKRLSSLNLSEEEYGKSKEKTEFDTDSEDDSDTDSDDDEDEGKGDSVGLEIFGNDSRFAVADDGWVSFSNQAA